MHYNPPESVLDLAEIVGNSKAFLIAGVYAKDRYAYIPKQLSNDHPLAKLVGIDAAEKLSQEFPGMMVYVASCKSMTKKFRDKAIVKAVLEGLTYAQVAQLFEVSTITVKKVMHSDRYQFLGPS